MSEGKPKTINIKHNPDKIFGFTLHPGFTVQAFARAQLRTAVRERNSFKLKTSRNKLVGFNVETFAFLWVYKKNGKLPKFLITSSIFST